MARKPCKCGTCHRHPQPDSLGRRPCRRCGCFTAATNPQIHAWCLNRTDRPRHWRT